LIIVYALLRKDVMCFVTMRFSVVWTRP